MQEVSPIVAYLTHVSENMRKIAFILNFSPVALSRMTTRKEQSIKKKVF